MVYGAKLLIYPSLQTLLIDDSEPLFELTFQGPSRPSIQFPSEQNISWLAAGDAHFSFIVNYVWSTSSQDMGITGFVDEPYYNNIWCIRTDSRSLDESAWIPVEEELSSLEDQSFVAYKFAEGVNMRVLCAQRDDLNKLGTFEKCVSCGWITAAISDEGEAWLFPFDRALIKMPQLQIGLIPEIEGARDIAVGSNHVVVATDREIWTFGSNDHGQRGFEERQNIEILTSWQNLEMDKADRRVIGVHCGRWNTFILTTDM
jgi:hypothetical protein